MGVEWCVVCVSSFIGIILCGAVCWPERMLNIWDAEGEGEKPFKVFGAIVTSCCALDKRLL